MITRRQFARRACEVLTLAPHVPWIHECVQTVGLVALTVGTSSACRKRRSGPAARVVSVSASTTETMFALGAGNKMVGRSRFCDYPPEASKLPVIGGYVDPNLEAILALDPDLVVGARGPIGAGLTRSLGDRGIATYFPETESTDQIFEMVRGVAARVGCDSAGDQLFAQLLARRDVLRRSLPAAGKKRVVLLFGKKPVSVAGPLGFPHEVLQLAGAQNAVTEGVAYPTLSIERLVALNPDLVLDASMDGQSFDSTFQAVPAIAGGRIRPVKDVRILRPGPRVLEGVDVLRAALVS